MFEKSQYLILQKRCMHELKTVDFEKVVENMDDENDATNSIQMTELGQSVLTLNEVIQTFESESCMFNVQMQSACDTQTAVYRTVVLKKNEVKINGKSKLIVMLNDVSATVRLKKDQLSKKRFKMEAQLVQTEFGKLIREHMEGVNDLCEDLHSVEDIKLQRLAVQLSK